MTKYIKFSIRKLGFWLLAVSMGVVFFGATAFAGTTPAITSATFTAGKVALLVEFNVPVWTDTALTTGLAADGSDFAYSNVSAGNAASISAVTHTAGTSFAIITLNAAANAADNVDTIRAVANQIFTVGGALSEKTVTLAADATGAPAITSVNFQAAAGAKSHLLVTFNKRVWSDNTDPPTTVAANADFAYVDTAANGNCASLGANPLAVAGGRSVVLSCNTAASAATDTVDTLAAAGAASLYDAWGTAMGVGTTLLTVDTTAPTITAVEAVIGSNISDGITFKALVKFSKPVFTDDPAAATAATALSSTPGTDITYTNGSANGATTFSAIGSGGSLAWMLANTGSSNFWAVLTLDAAPIAGDFLGGTDDTIEVSGATHIYDAIGNPMVTGVTVAQRTLNDTTDPVIITNTLNKTGASGQNTLAIAYSEQVTITGAPAAGANQASTTAIGDITTACTFAGYGAFAAGTLTYKTLLNTVALSAGGTTFTFTAAGQTGGYRTSATTTACSGNFTPQADEAGAGLEVVDLAPTPNKIEATSIQSTLTTTAAWDVAADTLTSAVATPSSAATTTATIGWTAHGASADFREYKFFYGTTTGAGALLAGTQWGVANDALLTTIGTTTTTLTGLNSGTIYFITPYVIDTFGNAAAAAAEMNIQTNSSTQSDKTPPSAPTSFAAVSKDGKALLTWIDPTATDLKDIVVLRGKNEFPVSGTPYAIAEKGAKTYTDSDVVAGDKVKYILRARDNANNESANTTEVLVTIVAAAPVVETPPAEEVAPPAEEKPALSEEEQKAVEEAAKKLEKALEKAQAQLAKYEAKVELYQAKLDKFLAKKKTKAVKKSIKKYKQLVSKYNVLVEKYNVKIEALQQ